MSYIEPLLLLFLTLSVVGLIRIRRSKTRTVLVCGVLGLFLLCWPPAEWLFSRPLESAYPVRPFRATASLQTIVVLGGGISPPQFERPYALANRDTFERCALAASLQRQMPSVPVLACEGIHPEGTFPSVMRQLLAGNGVPDDLIWIEDRSRNTHENATNAADILQRHQIQRIALVTDAQSMPRAAACFRKLGLQVMPAPCEFAELDFPHDLLPNWHAILRNERNLHEGLGLLWYRWRGWI